MAKRKQLLKRVSRYKGLPTFIATLLIVVTAIFSLTSIVRAHGGDESLHHACVGTVNGRLTIVGVDDECGGNETAMDWIKDVFVGAGLTINRASEGATLSLANSGVTTSKIADGAVTQSKLADPPVVVADTKAYQINATDGQTVNSSSYTDMTNGTQEIVLSKKSIVQVNAHSNVSVGGGSVDFNDQTSNSNTLTNNGVVAETGSTPFAASSIASDLESTESDYLSANDSTSLSITGNGTVETWVKFESLPGNDTAMALVSKWNSSNYSYRIIVYNDSGTYKLQSDISKNGLNTTGNVDTLRWNWTPSVGTWYHVAVTYTMSNAASSEMEAFINGSSQGNGSVLNDGSASSIYDGTAALEIGRSEGASYFDGRIDEVRIWNSVRTSTEINNSKSTELIGNETGLVAYYSMESLLSGGYIRTTYDSGGSDTEIGTQGYSTTTTSDQSITAGGVAVLNPGTYTIAMQKKGNSMTFYQPSMSIVIIPTQ